LRAHLRPFLSPAFDLTPSNPVSLERRDLALICGDWGRYASAANLLSQSARFLLAPDEAAHILDDIEARVRSSWYPVARSAGVSERDCETLKGAFAYPGFRAPPPGRFCYAPAIRMTRMSLVPMPLPTSTPTRGTATLRR
jgi:hypothetical protein